MSICAMMCRDVLGRVRIKSKETICMTANAVVNQKIFKVLKCLNVDV